MTASLLARVIIGAIAALTVLKVTAFLGVLPFDAIGRATAGQRATPSPPPRLVQAAPTSRAAASVTSPPRPAAPAAEVPLRLAANTPAPTLARAPEVPPPPPAAPSESEIGAALRARREALEERERTLVAREAVFAAAERSLNARITELAALLAGLEARAKASEERDEASWKTLARLYETMKPREAATVFNELDTPILVQVVHRMAERKAAPILGGMQPDRVRLLTAELAKLRATTP